MIEIKNFECSKSIRSYEKSNAWNIKRLVGGSIGQTNDRSIVLFHKLTELWTSFDFCIRFNNLLWNPFGFFITYLFYEF